LARSLFALGEFYEIFVDAPFEECVRRDPKGLYSRAMTGGITNFTGVDSAYEEPQAPDLHLKSMVEPVDLCVGRLMKLIAQR
jgi:bifunctional enzyme CysN/CysC